MNEPGAALVFRRLAIMDPSESSDQPMTDPSGSVTMVFNGEIYNYRALRERLEAKGTVFRSVGDSEVVLAGYMAWGAEVFAELEGMFAVGILDRAAGRFVAARDPLGIKPMYLTRRGSLVAVASEVRPLARLVGAEVDPAALPELLSFGWAAGRISNYRRIERVPGGTLIEVRLSDGRYVERRYCDPLCTLDDGPPASEEQAHLAVRRSLQDHLMSDVGFGMQFSGGVDSSLLVALAAESNESSLDTYAVKADDPKLDEGQYRDAVSHRYSLRNHEHDLSGERFGDCLPLAVAAMEGPVPHGGCVSLFSLCGEIAKKHKVVLTGEGADELFGGYFRYAVWRKLAQQEMVDRHWPDWLPVPAIWPLKGIRRLRHRDFAAYAGTYERLTELREVFPDLLPASPGAREQASARFKDFRERLLAVDQSAYLESLRVRQDKMSMARSVEARVPFAHMPLLRVVNRLPLDLRVPGTVTKPVLKCLAEKYLPRDTVHRRKAGLLLPYETWARKERALGRYLDDLTDPAGRLRSYGEGRRIDDVVRRFRLGEVSGLPRLFTLINMEAWLRTVSDPAGARLT